MHAERGDALAVAAQHLLQRPALAAVPDGDRPILGAAEEVGGAEELQRGDGAAVGAHQRAGVDAVLHADDVNDLVDAPRDEVLPGVGHRADAALVGLVREAPLQVVGGFLLYRLG